MVNPEFFISPQYTLSDEQNLRPGLLPLEASLELGVDIATVNSWVNRYNYPRAVSLSPGGHKTLNMLDVYHLADIKSREKLPISKAVDKALEESYSLPTQIIEALEDYDTDQASNLIDNDLKVYSAGSVAINSLLPAVRYVSHFNNGQAKGDYAYRWGLDWINRTIGSVALKDPDKSLLIIDATSGIGDIDYFNVAIFRLLAQTAGIKTSTISAECSETIEDLMKSTNPDSVMLAGHKKPKKYLKTLLKSLSDVKVEPIYAFRRPGKTPTAINLPPRADLAIQSLT